jgi:hypothetical protein
MLALRMLALRMLALRMVSVSHLLVKASCLRFEPM